MSSTSASSSSSNSGTKLLFLSKQKRARFSTVAFNADLEDEIDKEDLMRSIKPTY